jgi:hypothetical protein
MLMCGITQLLLAVAAQREMEISGELMSAKFKRTGIATQPFSVGKI